MKYVDPCVDRAAAVRMFERRRFGWLRRLLGQRRAVSTDDEQGARRLPYAELVWVPCYLVTIGLRTRRGPAEVSCTVEAHGGAFAIFGLQEVLRDGPVDFEPIPPELSAEGAELVARKELVHTIMRLRGGRRKSVPEETRSVELVQYPYWVYYYRPRPGRIDIRVLDAVTGKRPGAKTKTGILSAFVAASRRDGSNPTKETQQ